jgi:uncharacterized membrane protein
VATNRRALRWFKAQLPELVASGTITSENAAAIERYYAGADSRRSNLGFVILTSLGAALVGAGIILLVAHNWDEFSRPLRTVIAFVPLLIAQALIAFVLLRRGESRAWRELVAIFDVAALGAGIALVSQTYQFQGTLADFLRTWMLLSLPIVYLLRTTLGAVVYLVGSIVWLSERWTFFGRPMSPDFFWLLWLLVLPYFFIRYFKGRDTRETATLAIIVAVAAVLGLGWTAEFAHSNLGGVAFAGAVTAMYLVGMMFFSQAEGRLHPLALVGAVGAGVTALVLTFEGCWRISPSPTVDQMGARQLAVAIELFFPIAAFALAMFDILRRRARFSLPAAALPLVAALGWGIGNLCDNGQHWEGTRCSYAAATLMNVYVLWLGVDILARGIRVSSIARANFGLALIAGLALCRFFDSDLSFVTRGLGFIAVGVGFLVANVVMFKRRAVV